MISCAQVVELVSDYVEGRMSFAERMRFQFHLGICSHCRAYVRQMKVAVAALGRMPAEPPPPEVADALIATFRDWKAELRATDPGE